MNYASYQLKYNASRQPLTYPSFAATAPSRQPSSVATQMMTVRDALNEAMDEELERDELVRYVD